MSWIDLRFVYVDYHARRVLVSGKRDKPDIRYVSVIGNYSRFFKQVKYPIKYGGDITAAVILGRIVK